MTDPEAPVYIKKNTGKVVRVIRTTETKVLLEFLGNGQKSWYKVSEFLRDFKTL